MNARKAFYSIFNKDGQETFFKSGEKRTASIWTLSVPRFLQIILLLKMKCQFELPKGNFDAFSLSNQRKHSAIIISEMIH